MGNLKIVINSNPNDNTNLPQVKFSKSRKTGKPNILTCNQSWFELLLVNAEDQEKSPFEVASAYFNLHNEPSQKLDLPFENNPNKEIP